MDTRSLAEKASRVDLDAQVDAILDVLDPRFTETEEAVLSCLVRGLENPQISEELGMRTHTVHAHVHVILRTLRARSRGEAVYTALLLGLVTLGKRSVALDRLRERIERKRKGKDEGD